MRSESKLIALGHPNRPGIKLDERLAVVVHYTANDSHDASDTANASYFGRPFKRTVSGVYEADGKTEFRYGSAHVIIDEDSVTIAIPTDEVAWGCGDRHKVPWTAALRGQTPLARNFFGFRQNYRSISVEICNNGNWAKAVANAQEWIRQFLQGEGLKVSERLSIDPQTVTRSMLKVGEILVVRHYDVTGKCCPKPFVDDPKAWGRFLSGVI